MGLCLHVLCFGLFGDFFEALSIMGFVVLLLIVCLVHKVLKFLPF